MCAFFFAKNFLVVPSFNNTSCSIVILFFLNYLSHSSHAFKFHSTICSLFHLAKIFHNEYMCLMAHNSSYSLRHSKCNNGQRGYCSSIGIMNRSLECFFVFFFIASVFNLNPLFILLLATIVETNLGRYN
jgi:hypothetical protein